MNGLALAEAAISVLNALYIAKELGRGKEKRSGEGWMTLCPAHNDNNPSLFLEDRPDGSVSYYCHADCSKRDVRNALHKRGLLPGSSSRSQTKYFDYLDENGNPVISVRRFDQPGEKKRFVQYHFDSNGQRKKGVKDHVDIIPPYNLPGVIEAIRDKETVFIVEGEKHVDVLGAEGIQATTNVGGAGKWKDEYSDWLRGASVVILPDNDDPGEKHAQKVARSLVGKAREIRILQLTNLPEKGDVIDYLYEEGRDYKRQVKRLLRLAKHADLFQPEISDDIPAILEALTCSGEDFLNKMFHKPQILVRPFIREQSLTMIYARPGVGKSFLVHALAVALTRKDYEDLEIGPWRIRRPSGVLLIDGELPGGELQNRLRGMIKAMGGESDVHPLQVLTAEEVAIKFNRQLNLNNQAWRDAITKYVQKHPEFKMIVIDNISSLIPGVNENAKQDWDPVNQWLLTLRRTGNSVILIHHANKKGGDRGHSGRLDNLDNVITLEEAGETDEVKFKVFFQKCRYLKPGQGKPFTLELVEEPDGAYGWEMDTVNEPDNIFKDVIKLLTEDNVTQKQIAEIVGISQSRVSQLRQQAIKRGFLDTKNRITEDGEDFLIEE